MLPDRVSNPGPLTYESGALPIALRGPANFNVEEYNSYCHDCESHIPNTLVTAVNERQNLSL